MLNIAKCKVAISIYINDYIYLCNTDQSVYNITRMNELRDKILRRAMILFLSQNYDDVSILDIQEAVGCSRGGLYHYFSSKERIFEEVVNKYFLPALSNFSLSTKKQPSSLLDAIIDSVSFKNNYIGLFKKATSNKLADYHFFKFMFQVGDHYPGFRKIADKIIAQEIFAWKEIIVKAIQSGELRTDLDVDFMAEYFVMLPFGKGLYKSFNDGLSSNDIKISYMNFYNLIKK